MKKLIHFLHVIICTTILLCITSLTQTMNINNDTSQSYHLNELPSDIIGTIITQLAKNIGTPSLKNEADIPVIIKYTKALSLTNQDIYKKVNTPSVLNMLIESLTQRFDKDPVTIVSKINTPSAREWLKEHLKKTGEYELFKALQQIFIISKEIRKEFKSLNFTIRDGQKGWPKSSPSFNQTKQGFFIAIDSAPSELCTPWGRVMLFGRNSGGNLAQAFCQAFLKRFKISFMYSTKSEFDVSFYTLATEEQNGIQVPIDLKTLLVSGQNIDEKNIYKKLSIEEIKNLKGKDVLIWGMKSMYKIHAIDGQLLPEPETLPYTDYRNSESIKLIWDVLQDCYDQENGIKKNKNVTEKEKKFICSPMQNGFITSISTVVEECIPLLAQLDAQPLFNGVTYRTCKALSLNNYNDCRIINILCENANTILGKQKAWRIHDFGGFNNELYDFNGNDMGHGITQYVSENGIPCSLDDLKIIFHELVNTLITGWKQSTLTENPDIFHKESEEEWHLFIKPKTLTEENTLLYIFASIADIEKEIFSENAWYKPDGEVGCRDTLYLWIKKKSYDEVIEKLHLQMK